MVIATDELRFRPIEPDDAPRLERLFYRLSPETVYRRFFQPVHRPRERTLRHLATVDHKWREAVVAVLGDEIIGVARYDRVASTGEYEVAVLVEDAWQHQGVGRSLLSELSLRASENGIDHFTATVLGENEAVRRLIRSLSPSATFHRAGPEVDVVIPLERGPVTAA